MEEKDPKVAESGNTQQKKELSQTLGDIVDRLNYLSDSQLSLVFLIMLHKTGRSKPTEREGTVADLTYRTNY